MMFSDCLDNKVVAFIMAALEFCLKFLYIVLAPINSPIFRYSVIIVVAIAAEMPEAILTEYGVLVDARPYSCQFVLLSSCCY